MLAKDKVIAALEAKADHFAAYQVEISDALAIYAQATEELANLPREDMEQRLAGLPWPGARPTSEQDRHPDLVVPFAHQWDDYAAAQDWARQVLQNVPTIAVAGSYITPTKNVSLPLGAVQIGRVIDLHSGEKEGSVTDADLSVLAPPELISQDEYFRGFAEWRVGVRRFILECEKLLESMLSTRSDPHKPICFFDGSLVLSFIRQRPPEQQRAYLEALLALLETSRDCQVPLVGYTDSSYANDLTAMLNALAGRRYHQHINDGLLLQNRMKWGDRTRAYTCARGDQVMPLAGEKYYDQICFVYLQSAMAGPPARLDLPRWILEAGLLDRIVDVVLAECALGRGYPLSMQKADQVAVMSGQDQARFYQLFGEFAEREHLPFRFSHKAQSGAVWMKVFISPECD